MVNETLADPRIENTAIAVGISVNPNPHIRTRWEDHLLATWGDGVIDWTPGQCKGCGKGIEQPKGQPIEPGMESNPFAKYMNLPVTICNRCDVLASEHYSGTPQTPIQGDTPWWLENCPKRTQELITRRHISLDWKTIDRVRDWDFDRQGKGIAMSGDTAAGKTTALWALAQRLERIDRKPLLISSIELSRRLSRAARDIEKDTGLANCRYLLIDDLGKEKMTATMGATFCELIDERLNHGRWIVFTTRFLQREFADRFSELHLGKDIRRRLKEACEGVPFVGGGVD
jgi:hypothetical protein